MLSQSLMAQTLPPDDELLFYQSCDNTLQADVHRGKGQPNFVAEYSTSGRHVRFVMPDEPWNQVELTGSAYGTLGVSADTLGTMCKDEV